MDIFDELAGIDLRSLDPDGGVVAVMVCWRPCAKDPDPEQPGEKVFISSYLPLGASDLCCCGSGKRFADCCQPLPYWRPVCKNPSMQTYSLMHPQAAYFKHIPDDVVYAFLQNDERLYCVADDGSQHGCWLYWGDPAYDAPYGTLCFGDFTLSEDHSLRVSALSETRMEILLDLLKPLALDAPQMQIDPFPRLAKPRWRGSKR
ncbi:hypothetical protein KDH_48200 [Dictyobacter sp. S3.2.2.5]|uniref:Uncharacterized protein n=1 Tax=Dictyobacter halimunensis TaxID=3026934 RepID=A0ABQ6FUP9_9CHLR|nr:hypothetical protein KDH_48200 [Dictyobacter sp. S3.2.2.5]